MTVRRCDHCRRAIDEHTYVDARNCLLALSTIDAASKRDTCGSQIEGALLSARNREALARGRSPDLTPEQIAEAAAPMPLLCGECGKTLAGHRADQVALTGLAWHPFAAQQQ